MTTQSRATLKAYFETADLVTAQSFIDWFDSFVHIADTTAQTLNSDLSVPTLTATNVSAGSATITGLLKTSAAVFAGATRQGVSAGTSAADSRGYFLVTQEGTVAGAATAQVAFLPSTSNISRLAIKVLVNGSAAAGGVRVNAGTSDAKNFFGTISVSAPGIHEFSTVSAARLTGASGAILMNASAVSAATNIIGGVRYYQRA